MNLSRSSRLSVACLLVTPVLVTVALSACSPDDAVDSRSATADLPSTRTDIEAHEWVLVPADSTPRIESDRRVTMSVLNKTVSGVAPCNTYRAALSIDGDHFEVSDIAATRMASAEPLMTAETVYFEALTTVDTADLDDDENRLTLTGGNVTLVFDAYDADELLVGDWQIVNVNTGDSIDSVVAGTEPTLTFTEDGQATLDTGCNVASTTWTLDGNRLTVEPMRQTMKACDGPGVMEQEAALVAAFESSARIEVTPDSLTILAADGTIALEAVR